MSSTITVPHPRHNYYIHCVYISISPSVTLWLCINLVNGSLSHSTKPAIMAVFSSGRSSPKQGFISKDIFIELQTGTRFVLSIHWGRDKMAADFLTTFSNAFPWMKTFDFQIQFVSKGPINNNTALVHHLNQWWPSLLTHICHSASMS